MYSKQKGPIEKLTSFESSDHHASFKASTNFGGVVEGAKTTVIFRDLGDKLISLINKHSAEYGEGGFILAAVAWFSNARILDALIRARGNGVIIMVVVQKEDFLRQDSTDVSKTSFKEFLREKYDKLGTLCTDFSTVEASILMEADSAIDGEEATGCFWWETTNDSCCDAIRCVGNHNSQASPSFPRMHNKFMVFGKSEWHQGFSINPLSVWTGSFNCSACADKSFENAVIIESAAIATMYMKEFALLFLLSESLDWSSTWMRPEVSYST